MSPLPTILWAVGVHYSPIGPGGSFASVRFVIHGNASNAAPRELKPFEKANGTHRNLGIMIAFGRAVLFPLPLPRATYLCRVMSDSLVLLAHLLERLCGVVRRCGRNCCRPHASVPPQPPPFSS